MKPTNKIPNLRKKPLSTIISLLIPIIILLIITSLVIAQNDPGHDTLYIEEQGDSELNGSFNITQNLSVEGGRIRPAGGLILYGDDSIPAPGAVYISGTSSNNLYLDGQGNIFIKFTSGGDMVYIGNPTTATDVNISGVLYLGGNNSLNTSAAAGASGSDLYWGDKLVCNATQSNCGWATSVGGGGDITAVNTNDKWLAGGADTGDVSLTFNESELNSTIDARDNKTIGIGFSTSGATETLNLALSLGTNLTASFTDTGTGNCSGDQSCTGVLYDTNFTQLHQFGDCAEGTYIQNTTATGVECSTPTPATAGGWTDLGTTINLTTPSDNVSANTLFIDNTNNMVGIGTTSPNSSLHVNGNISQNDNLYHCFGDDCDGYIYWNGSSLIIKVS